MNPRITRLNETKIELSNGVKFTIVHNFEKMEGHNSFDSAFQNWLARTNEYTANSFVEYVKSKGEYGRIFNTLEDHKRITKGCKSATKKEYESENN